MAKDCVLCGIMGEISSKLLPPMIKLPGRETVFLSQSRVEIKSARNYAFTPPCIFMALGVIKHRHTFIVPEVYTSVFISCTCMSSDYFPVQESLANKVPPAVDFNCVLEY